MCNNHINLPDSADSSSDDNRSGSETDTANNSGKTLPDDNSGKKDVHVMM